MGERRAKRSGTKNARKFTSKMQMTLLGLFGLFIIGVIWMIVVLVNINHQDGERYSKKALNQQTYVSSEIPYKRGDITDRNGTVLATSVKVYNLILDMKILLQCDEEYITNTLSAINKYFKISMEDLNRYKEEKKDSSYIVLEKQIDSDRYLKFKTFMDDKKHKIKGVWFEEEYKRVYPNDALASSVIGFTVSGDVGTNGIEYSYNSKLAGTNGLSYGYFDSELNLVRTNKDAENGNNIVTTLDASVQRIVEQKIKDYKKEQPTKRISVLVMNPNNGDVYAMATDVSYNLNDPRDLTPFYKKSEIKTMDDEERLNKLYDIWRNTIVSNNFEPGSTFKPFTIAAALEENVIGYNDEYNCDGHENVAGVNINCNKVSGHGHITLTQAIMLSCNDALMKIGAEEGKHIFHKYQTSFLFGSKTNIDLPGEATGIILKEDALNPVELATSSFGQTSEVTMVQLASAFSSLVNGGNYYEPHIMKQITSDKGAIVDRNDGVLVKQTISKETSDFLKNALYKTVEEGTAQGAKVEGYAVGGKTGTAQKYPRTDRKFILSFIGAVPIDDPQVVVYVTLDEVEDELHKSDSKLATTFASSIMKEILPFLGVYPSGDIDYSIWGFDTKGKADKSKKSEKMDKDDPLKDVVNSPMTDEYNGDSVPDDVQSADQMSGTEGNKKDEAADVGKEYSNKIDVSDDNVIGGDDTNKDASDTNSPTEDKKKAEDNSDTTNNENANPGDTNPEGDNPDVNGDDTNSQDNGNTQDTANQQ